MDKVVEELTLNVINKCTHQFQKDNVTYDATMILFKEKTIYLFIIKLLGHQQEQLLLHAY